MNQCFGFSCVRHETITNLASFQEIMLQMLCNIYEQDISFMLHIPSSYSFKLAFSLDIFSSEFFSLSLSKYSERTKMMCT
jgi:hypothetical protein